MPLYEFGYRAWEGKRRPRPLHFWPIARNGVYLAGRSKMLKRFLLIALFPIAYFVLIFFAIGVVTDPSASESRQWAAFVGSVAGSEEAATFLLEEPVEARQLAWTLTFYIYFAWVQTWIVMIVVALVGPPLIAQDIRSKAFLIYFSKPINRWDYILGKALVVLVYVLAVTLLPAVILAVLAVAMASDVQAIWQILPILPKVGLAALIVAVPCTCVVLLLSSLTNYERFALFAWLFVWIGGLVLYANLSATAAGQQIEWLRFFSLRDTTMASLSWVFDVEGMAQRFGVEETVHEIISQEELASPGKGATGFLALLSGACLLLLARRVAAPHRV